jgi:hypothetical protein
MEENELEDVGPPMEMLDTTEAFLEMIERIALQNFGALETVRGNLLFVVQDVAVRNVVTSGPKKGIYGEATDEPAHFIFAIQQWALLHLLDPDPARPMSLAQFVEDGAAVIEGDSKVYERFMSLDEKKRGLVSIRLG